MKKLVAIILSLSCLLGAFGCGPIGTGPSNFVDTSTTTKIIVKNYNGGVGRQWLDNAAARFTAANKTTSFAEGKTGVYVEIADGDTTGATMSNETYQIYITSGANMSVVKQAQLKTLYDMTSIVTDTNREGGSLDSIMYDSVKDAFMYDEKYYGIPHYSLSNGLSYDRELFDDKLLYFADENETDVVEYTGKDIKVEGKFIASLDAKKSVGLDGIEGTEDDGIACSIEELILLMDYIKNEMSIAPIVVSGKYEQYIEYYTQAITASIAGPEQMSSYTNCVGDIDIVEGFSNEPLFPGIDYIKKPIVKTVTLSEVEKNGYLVTKLAAKFYAMATVEIMHKEGYFSKEAYNDSIDHLTAQKCLVYGGAAEYDQVAMLMEGSYWYNEAKKGGVLSAYKTISGNKKERDVRWMSLPTVVYAKDVEIGEVPPISAGAGAQLVINANIKGNAEAEAACAAFVQFLYSDAELAAFTVETGCPRNFEYYLTDAEIEKMPYFYQSIWRSRKEDGSNTSIQIAKTETGKKVASAISLGLNATGWEGFEFYHYIRNTKNTQEMFEDMQYTKETWDQMLSN